VIAQRANDAVGQRGAGARGIKRGGQGQRAAEQEDDFMSMDWYNCFSVITPVSTRRTAPRRRKIQGDAIFFLNIMPSTTSGRMTRERFLLPFGYAADHSLADVESSPL
jgi:hypothetical protein